ncbi:MAG: hypothetical protein D5R99_04495, partial [Methanocalculus sp. MSAO_Arc1]|uniref:hypothetical protein n=1 Tax=Methanocalculus sp. MSAO_Arc1 TaxID=2293854 RepID=UPI000FF3FCA7
ICCMAQDEMSRNTRNERGISPADGHTGATSCHKEPGTPPARRLILMKAGDPHAFVPACAGVRL